MAVSQRRAFSNDHTSINSSLKSEHVDQLKAVSYKISETPAEEPCAIRPHRSATGDFRTRSHSHRPSRLSLSIPIAPRKNSIDSITNHSAPIITPPICVPHSQTPISPSDSNSFLVALASQERYVFELREELQKAEDELQRLKTKWASHEALKKRGEISNMELLRPLQSLGSDENDMDDISVLASQNLETEKQKGSQENVKIYKESRRIFTGSHTRALSLLSPEQSDFDKLKKPQSVQVKKTIERNAPRSSALLGTSRNSMDHSYRVRNLYSPKNVTSGAKQLVDLAEDVKEGFKAGMWTFFEDLRQATVGDEGVNGSGMSRTITPDTQASDSKTNDKTTPDCKRRNLMNRTSLPRTWENLIGNSPSNQSCSEVRPDPRHHEKRNSIAKSRKSSRLSPAISTVDELEDPWLVWESPDVKSPRWSNSTLTSDLITPPNSGSFDRDIKIIGPLSEHNMAIQDHRDPSWLVFKNLSPGNLKGNLQQTFSSVFKEFEIGMVTQYGDSRKPMPQNPNIASTYPLVSDDTSIQEEILYMSR